MPICRAAFSNRHFLTCPVQRCSFHSGGLLHMIRLSIRITFGWHSLYYAQNSCVNQLKDISLCGCEVYRCRIADL